MTMITFDRGTDRFNYRVVGVAIERGRILLGSVDDYPFWVLPGGRAELLETSTEAVEREMFEELGIPVKSDRLLWMVEHFYTLDGFDYHEIGMYHLIQPVDGTAGWNLDRIVRFEDGGSTWTCQWHDLDSIDRLELRPPFLHRILGNIPDTPQHIVIRESPVRHNTSRECQ